MTRHEKQQQLRPVKSPKDEERYVVDEANQMIQLF